MKTLNLRSRKNLSWFVTMVLCLTLVSFVCERNGRIVTCTVTDQSGSALSGVSVTIKGSTKAVITDVNGKYILEVPDSMAVLGFSYVGYIQEQIAVKTSRTINIT